MEEKQNWKDSFRASFKSVNDLNFFSDLKVDELTSTIDTYALFLPVKLAQKIKAKGINSPLGKQFLPNQLEIEKFNQTVGLHDPIGDQKFLKAPQLIHRYRSRALFTPTSKCPVNCRYCFRKNEINEQDDLFEQNFKETISYIKHHPEISEIIFTGGDPLTLSNEKLRYYLESFLKIESIKDIRFHSRYPVIMPERFDDELIGLFELFSKKFRTLSLAIHCNHVDELDHENLDLIKRLGQLPIQLLGQTVLLKGVNDSVESLISLFNEFINIKIRPYYLHHPDQVKGGLHFYISLEEGRRIYAKLRRHLPGWAIPNYIFDIPAGEGKVSAFNPEAITFSGTFINMHSETIAVQEPDAFDLKN